MSYPMSLDDYTTDQLHDEISRRNQLMRCGRCPYCKTAIASEKHHCKWATCLDRYHNMLRQESTDAV